MSRTLIVTKVAEWDILDGYLSYEEKQVGIGLRFMNEIEQAFDRILLNPFLYQKVETAIRRAVTHTFPYLVFYTFDEQTGQYSRSSMALKTLPISMSGLTLNHHFETTPHLRFLALQAGR